MMLTSHVRGSTGSNGAEYVLDGGDGGVGNISAPFIYSVLLHLMRPHLLLSVQQAFEVPVWTRPPVSRPPPTPISAPLTKTRLWGLVCAWVCVRNHLSFLFLSASGCLINMLDTNPQLARECPPFPFMFYYSHSFTQRSLSSPGLHNDLRLALAFVLIRLST